MSMILPERAALATAMIVLAIAPPDSGAQSVHVTPFGETGDGQKVYLYTLTNAQGLSAKIMTHGATLIAIETPDRDGKLENITLHLGSFADYQKGHPLFGSVVGRFANRIDTGGFTIDGKHYELETVNRKTGVHIHGGKTGFQKQLWEAKPIKGANFAGVELTLTSPDGHEGFPGEVEAKVSYRLTNEDELVLDYTATTDQPTHLNLTNHAYFNLAGAGSGDVLDQVLTLRANHVLAIDDRKIPTGDHLPIGGTPFDFRKPQPIGARIAEIDGGGYDHCYVLNQEGSFAEPTLFARIEDPKSGRVMEALTTSPGVQLYTANYLKPTLKTPDGKPYGPHHGFCLETQFFPDAPNNPQFPSSLLRPGETWRQTTVFRFSVVEGEASQAQSRPRGLIPGPPRACH